MLHPIISATIRSVALVLVAALLAPSPLIAAPAGPTYKGDPQAIEELKAVFARFNAARTWRSRMTSKDFAQTTDYVAPDRLRMVMNANNQVSEIFVIGRDIWTKSGSTCNKAPFRIPFPNPKEIAEHGNADATIAVTKGGRETVEGTATQTYNLAVETRGTTTQEKLHVAVGTGMPRRIELKSSQGEVVIDYFDFNASITIEPPC